MAGRGKTMHEHIAATLRNRIAYGVYPEGEFLPPEMLLVAEFECSRHTVREAMKALVAEGLIQRRAGHGTVVAPRPALAGTWALKSISDLVGEFTDSQVVLLKRGVVKVSAFAYVGQIFKLPANASLYCIQRVLSLRSGPTAFNRLFTLVRYASRIPKKQLGYQTLIGQIEAHCDVQAYRTRQVATAVEADSDIAKVLGVRKGTPLLKLRRTYLSREDLPIEYTELVCRPDRYEQTVEFHREHATPDRP